jgi:hypothetical protein
LSTNGPCSERPPVRIAIVSSDPRVVSKICWNGSNSLRSARPSLCSTSDDWSRSDEGRLSSVKKLTSAVAASRVISSISWFRSESRSVSVEAGLTRSVPKTATAALLAVIRGCGTIPGPRNRTALRPGIAPRLPESWVRPRSVCWPRPRHSNTNGSVAPLMHESGYLDWSQVSRTSSTMRRMSFV